MAEMNERLQDYLMNHVDNDNILVVETVERYIDLLNLMNEMQRIIEKDGPTVEAYNAHGPFTKSHPLISDMKNINAQLINLKKDIDKHIAEHAEFLESQKGDYSAKDLV